MKPLLALASFRALREKPLWRLLAADKAPAILALLQGLFAEPGKALPSSILHDRLSRELDDLRTRAAEDLRQSAQRYIADWLTEGWLSRRLPAGASEEEYELTAEATAALRFMTDALQPRTVATESRLSLIIQQLVQLSDETNPNPSARLKALQAQRDHIDRFMAQLEHGQVKTISPERALERTREVIAMAQELAADFRGVRAQFEQLNRNLRKDILENEASRGQVLDQLFAGMDVIGDSEQGKSFDAFWKLLTDDEQSSLLLASLDEIAERDFFKRRLSAPERKVLLGLPTRLLAEGTGVHDVLQAFARSLRSFVQSREFQEQRRINALLLQATRAALALKDTVPPSRRIDYHLAQTSGHIRSLSQWAMFDPTGKVADATMHKAEPAELDVATVSEMVRNSEIDFRSLKQNVLAILSQRSQASISQVLQTFPAEQGLGSVIGYVSLGHRFGELGQGTELVSWTGLDEVIRSARVPSIYFVKERADELAATV